MQPALFISHGAPDLAITPSAVHDFLINFGKEHPRPDAIIIASAHYETLAPEIGAGANWVMNAPTKARLETLRGEVIVLEHWGVR